MMTCCDANMDKNIEIEKIASITEAEKIASMKQEKTAFTIALLGNPNCGKTTLFNALTGANQRVGNWPGVTVERKSGAFNHACTTVSVVDLPGIYSLTLAEVGAIDERIAWEFICKNEVDLIVNIIDASHLERHLYLTAQLLERDVPIILALNMMDVARAKEIDIQVKDLADKLNCPVIPIEANNGKGLIELKEAIANYQKRKKKSKVKQQQQQQQQKQKQLHHPEMLYPAVVMQAIQTLNDALSKETCRNFGSWLAIALLENDQHARELVSPPILNLVPSLQENIHHHAEEDADILLADARYLWAQQLMRDVVKQRTQNKTTWTKRIDGIVLNRFLGMPIFLGVMYFLFFFSINIGGAFQDFFDISSQTIFVDGFQHLLDALGSPAWLTVIFANGIGKGINTTVTFVPVIGAMFLCLAFLEDSGYMARAAFVVDRLMRALGLPGKAFVPMIVGFGCNVPAVMGARTLENQRDRILTIMMSPFMSCGARLAIFAIFTAAFFPRGGQNIVFLLYLIGIGMAVFTGFILRKTVLKGDASPLVMELPLYHLPRSKTLLLHAWQRLKQFIFRAGKLIVPICILIGALNALTIDGSIQTGDGDARSILSLIGQWTTFIFHPMGIDNDNWPATVGLLTGVLAKEVVVGTLNALYSQIGQLHAQSGIDSFSLLAHLKEALASVPANFAALGSAFSNPILAQAPLNTLDQSVYGLMYQKFDGQIGAFAYLLFVLLYFPCVSTTAAMLRELHKGWAVFSVCWMTGIAYGTAVMFYQAATWGRHPLSSSIWVLGILGALMSTFLVIKWYAFSGMSNGMRSEVA